jgi:hypothetical protein
MIGSRLRTLVLGALLAIGVAAPAAASAQFAPLPHGSWQLFTWFVDQEAPVVQGDGFTLTSDHGATIRVADSDWAGDAFDIFVNGQRLYSTPSVDVAFTEAVDGDAAWGATELSRGSFFLGAGTHTITLAVREHIGFVDGQGFIRADFALAPGDPTVTPEPATVLLVGSGLLVAGVAARRRRAPAQR